MLKYRNVVFGLIVFYLLIRLSFVGVGAISGPDENRYLRSCVGLEALINKGDTKTFFKHIVINVAIPFNQIIQFIPCSLQIVLKKTIGLSPENPVSLIIPQIFNWMVFIIIVILLYNIFNILFRDKNYAIGVTLVCILLSNMNIYTRHLIPYDNAMAMALICLLYYLRSDFINDPSRAFVLGLLCSLAFATYPGYYFSCGLIIGLCLFNRQNWQSYNKLFKLSFFFVSGFFIVICFFELLGRLGGTSYIVSMLTASGKITQGDFPDGFIFIPRYFYYVEGINGVCIITLYFIGVIYALKQVIKGSYGNLEIIIVLSMGGMLFHSSLSYFFHKMVWYGRLMHIYLPFIVTGAAYFCYQLVSLPTRRNIIVAVFILAGAIHFAGFAKSYYDQQYPKDVLYKLRINSLILGKNHFIDQFDVTDDIRHKPDYENGPNAHISLPPAIDSNYYSKDTGFYLINVGFIWPVTPKKSFDADRNALAGKKLIFSFHGQCDAYMYEQCDSTQRADLTHYNTGMEIYR